MAGSFWLRASHEVGVKMSSKAVVIEDLTGTEMCFQVHPGSSRWDSVPYGLWSDFSVAWHLGFSIAANRDKERRKGVGGGQRKGKRKRGGSYALL